MTNYNFDEAVQKELEVNPDLPIGKLSVNSFEYQFFRFLSEFPAPTTAADIADRVVALADGIIGMLYVTFNGEIPAMLEAWECLHKDAKARVLRTASQKRR